MDTKSLEKVLNVLIDIKVLNDYLIVDDVDKCVAIQKMNDDDFYYIDLKN